MRKRAEQIDETRQKITEAAMRLHTSVGPANTTISAVADEADVTRVTVYSHFPDEETLFLACSSHWWSLHPSPDPNEWLGIDGVEQRTRHALTQLYTYYRANHSDMYPIMRDFEAMPSGFRALMKQQAAAMSAALVAGSGTRRGRRRRLAAVAGHVTSFWAWWSLAIEGGLDDEETIYIMVNFVLSV
jgi:AcrR family transcriptional regulator